MKQDVMTALQEMRKQLFYMALAAGSLFLNLFAFMVAILLLGATVWLFAHYFLWGVGATVVVLIGAWFWCEYTTARDIRIWEEMCRVNKGEEV